MYYKVAWEIDIEADSPEDAARKALAIQRDSNSIATVYEVWGDDQVTHVDLTELDECCDEAPHYGDPPRCGCGRNHWHHEAWH